MYIPSLVVLFSSPAAGALNALLLREPLSAREITALSASGDIGNVELIDAVFTHRLDYRDRFPSPLIPLDLDREIAAALLSLERLLPERAVDRARELMTRPAARDSEAGDAARAVLARSGEPSVLREALVRFFEAPNRWGALLEEAARAQEDPRLFDFERQAPSAASETSLRLRLSSRLERNLTSFPSPSAVRALVRWSATAEPSVAARVLSRVVSHPGGSRESEGVNRALARLARSAPDREARLVALSGLGRRRAREQIPVLLDVLAQTEPHLAAAAALALGSIGDPDAVVSLERTLESSLEPTATASAVALVDLLGAGAAKRLASAGHRLGLRAAVAVLGPLAAKDGSLVPRVLDRLSDEGDRPRILLWLARADRAELGRLLRRSEVDDLHPYLATSAHRELRELVFRVSPEQRGAALGALLVSARAGAREKERAIRELGDSLWEAVAAGGRPVLGEIERFGELTSGALDPAALGSQLAGPRMVRVLELLPGAGARRMLEGSERPEALAALLRREDRVLALPLLTRLARSAAGPLRSRARNAIVQLDAPGALAILQEAVARGDSLEELLPALGDSDRGGEALRVVASRPAPAPGVVSALYRFHSRYPRNYLDLLSEAHSEAARRLYAVLALSGDEPLLPLLVDEAANAPSSDRRLAAFRGLEGAELGGLAFGLHRGAGDARRRIRFETALALVPTGEPSALRLLVANADEDDELDVRRVRGVWGRRKSADALGTLEGMIGDGTATALSITLYLDELAAEGRAPSRGVSLHAWELLRADAKAGRSLALLAASRLPLGEPRQVALEWMGREPPR